MLTTLPAVRFPGTPNGPCNEPCNCSLCLARLAWVGMTCQECTFIIGFNEPHVTNHKGYIAHARCCHPIIDGR